MASAVGEMGNFAQLAPPSVLLDLPAYSVPGSCGSTAQMRLYGSTGKGIQLSPPLTVLLSSPLSSDAYTVPVFRGSIASARTRGRTGAGVQLAAPSGPLKRPTFAISANRVRGFRGSMASPALEVASNPAFAVVQLEPPSELLRTPRPVPPA